MSGERLSEDIVDELEARGDELSKRAARYIRLKRQMLAGRESEIRHMVAVRNGLQAANERLQARDDYVTGCLV